MPHKTLDPQRVSELIGQDSATVYIDVRTVQEFEQSHVPGSYNIPILFMTAQGMLPNPEFVATVKRHFPSTQTIVFGCKSGGRSQRACEMLEREGYRSLINMSGGLHSATDMSGNVVEPGWIACGLETARASEPGRSWKELGKK
jgi:rhodanese-related sulfurtransferase